MGNFTSITITRKSSNLWVLQDNTMASVDVRAEDEYSGGINGNYVTIRTKNGGIVYNKELYSIFSYVDETDPDNNFEPTSAVALMQYLINAGFFGVSSGGGAGATTFLELLDVLIPNYFGREGEAVIVNSEGLGLTTIPLSNVQVFQDLLNWLGGDLMPNKYIITSGIVDENGFSIGLQQADIDTIINTPIPVDFFRLVEKGVQEVEGETVINQEPYVIEKGDYVELTLSDDGNSYRLRYNNGDTNLLASYELIYYTNQDRETIFTALGLAETPDTDDTAEYILVLDANGKVKKIAKTGITGVETVTGTQVDNTDPANPVIDLPTKADIGLGNVDNTSDANKPVSTAQQTALDLKLNIEAGSQTGGAVSFTIDNIYGTTASPVTANITANLTGAKRGVTNIMIHNSGTAPTFGSEFKKFNTSLDYQTGVNNYIYMTYINSTTIVYSIRQLA